MKRNLKGLVSWAKMAALLASSGTLLATTCTTDQVDALVAGVTIIADELQQDNNDVSFGDWIQSEFGD